MCVSEQHEHTRGVKNGVGTTLGNSFALFLRVHVTLSAEERGQGEAGERCAGPPGRSRRM